MRVLVDTNVLLRSVQPGHPHSSHARQAVVKLLRTEASVFVCAQNMIEFWNAATRPLEKNGLGLTNAEVLQEVSSIEFLLTLLPDLPAIYPVWKGLVAEHQVQGLKVHDARIVALMKVHAVESILTFNDADFKRYGSISALHPSMIVA